MDGEAPLSFDYDRAEQVLGDRGTRGDCVLCGNTVWVRLGAMRNLMAFVPAATPHGELVRGQGTEDGIFAYVFACANCGFLRQHGSVVLDQELPEVP